MTPQALINGRVLTPDGFIEGQTVLVTHGLVTGVVPDSEAELAAATVHDLGGNDLLPGFVDLQVNGGGGVLFNDAPTVESIRKIGEAHRAFGTTGFLPTLISDDLDKVAAAIAAVDDAIEAEVPGVLGIHLEGPFLNKNRKGVHDENKFRVLDEHGVALLSSLRHGKTLVTLAPERTSPDKIQALADSGVIVAAGHSDARYDEVRLALDAGLSGFTHLFNAMSPMTSREPGVVGAALDDRDSWCGLIADGHHVHEASLRVALASKPPGKCLLVTDAMSSVGATEKSFQFGGQAIHVENGRCVTDDGTLAGSDLDMASAVRNTIRMLRVDAGEAARMASQYPANALGLGDRVGRIMPGFKASLVLVDHDQQVLQTWIDGVAAP
jgi:N-acetylglucosamine-6-phosphate deacetylase